MNAPFPLRTECPPGACICGREALLSDPDADLRALRLTRAEEKRLVERLENLTSLAELQRMEGLMQAQLGIVLSITPSARGVRTVRGISIQVLEQPGLCRKIRQSIPSAIRRSMEAHPEIAYAIVDAHDLLGGA
ncbi:hypothetical protein MKD50_08555 [Cupriavidus sp. WGtm5]|uniref:hypothetical protein n=1 Tax=Cupriavidus sp. WGtm5 TaxID=2919926 RepID=UPI000E1918AD|nr:MULTISPECIES: hypothetical protein [Cupriavidus]MCO4889412.1 hypothetical protein [Cupriavidus sp. WGtm5]SPA36918.1 conserved hypothetical protein [Cupriavidus taiwanensis]